MQDCTTLARIGTPPNRSGARWEFTPEVLGSLACGSGPGLVSELTLSRAPSEVRAECGQALELELSALRGRETFLLEAWENTNPSGSVDAGTEDPPVELDGGAPDAGAARVDAGATSSQVRWRASCEAVLEPGVVARLRCEPLEPIGN
jgi:hypothetical protein